MKIIANGNSIKIKRIKSGMTLTEVAKKGGLCLGTMSKIENGVSGTRPPNAKKICKILNSEFEELFKLIDAGGTDHDQNSYD